MAVRHGYHAGADAQELITATRDGVNLNELWATFRALNDAQNEQMNNLVQLLTFRTTTQVEQVLQGGDPPLMEEASEFGIATAQRLLPGYFNVGFGFKEYDMRAGYTWRFLRRADSNMVRSMADASVGAYRKTLFNDMMRSIFNNVNVSATINGSSVNIYRFYNDDGTVPPAYAGTTFDGDHDHYRVTEAAAIEAADLDGVLDDFDSHGYGFTTGYQVLFLVNRQEGNAMRAFRTAANGGTGGNAGRYDFIPSVGAPGQIITTTQQLVGQSAPPATYNGLTVIGSYGNALIVQDSFIPAGYVLALASGGPLLPSNPLGLYEEPGYSGLQLFEGPDRAYPLQDSHWWAGFGFGVRHRGAGMVLQIKASGTYDIPAAYA